MAQLKDTTIDGSLSVTSSITSGGLLTGNRLVIESGSFEFYGSENGKTLKGSISNYKPHIDFYYGGGDESERTSSITESYTGELNINDVEITDSKIYANRLILPNGYSMKSYLTSGELVSLMFMSTSDNLMVGIYSSDGHTGDTYINSYNNNVYLKNKNRALNWRTNNGTNTDAILSTSKDGIALCGSSSYRWYCLYAASATVLTSDEREKSNIISIADYPTTYSRNGQGNVFEQLFDKLEPKTYILNVDETGETHTGFVAQDIEKSMHELGLDTNDLGLIIHDYWVDEETGEERDRYGLAYEEFIALNTYIIQKQKTRIAELESQFAVQEERISRLLAKLT